MSASPNSLPASATNIVSRHRKLLHTTHPTRAYDFTLNSAEPIVAKLWPEKTDTVGYVGPTICNKTGNGPKSSLAATCLIVID